MIAFWNRKQLLITFSSAEQADIRRRLAAAGIDYTCRCVNRRSSSAWGDTRMRTGTLGEKPELAEEYIFYVKREEYEQARALLARIANG